MASLRAIVVLRFEQSIIHTKSKFKIMEDIQLYLAHNYLSFLISSITGAGKAAIIFCTSLTKETKWENNELNIAITRFIFSPTKSLPKPRFKKGKSPCPEELTQVDSLAPGMKYKEMYGFCLEHGRLDYIIEISKESFSNNSQFRQNRPNFVAGCLSLLLLLLLLMLFSYIFSRLHDYVFVVCRP